MTILTHLATDGASDSASNAGIVRLINVCIIIIYLFIIIFIAQQHKAAGVKTKQNVKQPLQRLLIRCSLCCCSPATELWTGVETERLFLWCPA